MRMWRWLNSLAAWKRWPLKLVLFLVGTFVVLYPKLWLFPTFVQRISNINSVLDPENPALADLETEVRAKLDENPELQPLAAVQQEVYARVPYGWDWEVWGVVEYLPTVSEVFERGREDCDGRAVVAASLLRRMGYEAWLVSDLLHMWVQTPEGETMSPTGGEKTIVGGDQGTLADLASIGMIENAGRGLAYGVAVFPLLREILILALLCVLSVHPRSSGWRQFAGCLLLWIGLDLIRHTGQTAAIRGGLQDSLVVLVGVVILLAGWLVVIIRAGASPQSPVEPTAQ